MNIFDLIFINSFSPTSTIYVNIGYVVVWQEKYLLTEKYEWNEKITQAES